MELGHFEHRWTSGRKSFILGRTGTIIFLDTFVATATKTGPTGCLSGFTENASTIHKLISNTNRKHFISQWWKLSNDWVKTVQKFLSNKNRSLERNCKRIASEHNRLLSKAFSFFSPSSCSVWGDFIPDNLWSKAKEVLEVISSTASTPPKRNF